MPGFPFLDLPLLAQLEILKNFDFYDTVALASLSKRTRAICKGVYPVDSWTWECNSSAWQKIELRIPGRVLRLSMKPSMNLPFETMYLNGKPLMLTRHSWWEIASPTNAYNTNRELLEELTQLVFGVVRCTSFTLILNKEPSADLFVWKYVKKFARIFILMNNYVEDSMMRFMLEQCSIDHFQFHATPTNSFKFSGPLTNRIVTIRDSWEWITTKCWLNMECEHVLIQNRAILFETLNGIIRKWRSGGLLKLRYFQMRISKERIEEAREQCLKNIETIPWDAKNRPKTYKCALSHEHNLSSGRDFQRKDGVFATFDVTNNGTVRFVTWLPENSGSLSQ